MRAEHEPIRIGVVGKYIELHDAYMSMREALFHAAGAQERKLEISWIYSGDLEKDKGWDELEKLDGIVVPGGFGERGVEGKILAARFARERKVPYLGLCLGMQVMCIEFARNVLELEDANSSEFGTHSTNPVIDLMNEQRSITDMGGTMRLGTYPCRLEPNTVAAKAYGNTKEIQERHRHRFEFNNQYRTAFQQNGMVFSGLSPDRNLVEIAEVKDHPFMLGSQFHPEFLSRPNLPHPLFLAFIKASINHSRTHDGNEKQDGQHTNGYNRQHAETPPQDETETRN
jgi:CTP synthase